MDHAGRQVADAVRGRTLPAPGADQRGGHLVRCEVHPEARHADPHQEDAEESLVSESVLVSDRQFERGEESRVAHLALGAISEQPLELGTGKLSELSSVRIRAAVRRPQRARITC